MIKGKLQQKIINMKGCIPTQDKYIDKENPEFICPVELENGFYEKKIKLKIVLLIKKLK